MNEEIFEEIVSYFGYDMDDANFPEEYIGMKLIIRGCYYGSEYVNDFGDLKCIFDVLDSFNYIITKYNVKYNRNTDDIELTINVARGDEDE